tara:strand:- start:1694 stop:2158 length:465 start_codon:yes stop_codon:yes gene_type:complete
MDAGCHKAVPTPRKATHGTIQKKFGTLANKKCDKPKATKADARIIAVRLLYKSASNPEGIARSGPAANCLTDVSVPISTLLRPNPDLIDGIRTGHNCWNQWIRTWPKDREPSTNDPLYSLFEMVGFKSVVSDVNSRSWAILASFCLINLNIGSP